MLHRRHAGAESQGAHSPQKRRRSRNIKIARQSCLACLARAPVLISLSPASSFAQAATYLHTGCRLYIPVSSGGSVRPMSTPQRTDWRATALGGRSGVYTVRFDPAADTLRLEPAERTERYVHSRAFIVSRFEEA